MKKNLLIFVFFLSLSNTIFSQVDTAGRPGFRLINKAVPSFTAISIDGLRIDSNYFKNKLTVLVFMSPGCAPCKCMLPKLSEWAKRFSKDTFQLLVIYDSDPIDTRDFRSSKSRRYGKMKRKFGLDSLAFDFIAECAKPDPHFFARTCNVLGPYFNVRGWPSTFFISPDGIIRNHETGYALANTKFFDLYFDQLLDLTVRKEHYVFNGK